MPKPMPDPYTVLGVTREADEERMRDAYRRLAKRYHPDLHPDTPTSERMGRVNDAWHVLSDPARRARYDAEHPRVAGSARPWPPAWAPGAAGSASDSQPAGWSASSWTSRTAPAPRTRGGVGSASGPPWLAVLAILAVGWLVVGGFVGGFPLPVVFGVIAFVAASSVIDRLA